MVYEGGACVAEHNEIWRVNRRGWDGIRCTGDSTPFLGRFYHLPVSDRGPNFRTLLQSYTKSLERLRKYVKQIMQCTSLPDAPTHVLVPTHPVYPTSGQHTYAIYSSTVRRYTSAFFSTSKQHIEISNRH